MNDAVPGISVVVVTCERPLLLADALRSIAAQRLAPLEVRIANDGVGPVEDVVERAGLGRVALLASRAGCAAAARNLAARDALGEAIAFLDDDDRWMPDHLEGLARAFADPAVGIAYRDAAVVRETLEPGGARRDLGRRVIARDWDPEIMRHDDYVAPSAFAIRRSLLERLGGFDETFRFSEDWDLLMRAAALTTPRRVPGVTVEVRLREAGNASADRSPERRACLDRLSARHGLPALAIKTFWEVALALDGARSPA
jgi:glycosyltransferase involved in cell wall biosynthesis